MPLRGSVPLSEYIDGLEAEDAMALHLRDARKSLNSVLGVHPSLRKLRLAAGLSQAKLAVAAKTTQSYIARVESGSLDPGTDMVSRIAHAIDVTDVEVFVAIRNQRGEDT
jgi:ribosome-binding protein aMBF1 (putative translation factor)